MTAQMGNVARVPLQVSLFSPILKFLLAAGVPIGYNGLITIPGRKSGLPRTTPVAIIAVSAGDSSGLPGARSIGCAICELPDTRPSTTEAGRKKYERPSWIRPREWGSFATSLARSREASRSASRSFASSMGWMSDVRSKRPRVDGSSSSIPRDAFGW